MPTIRPMADLRDTGKISELCYQKNEPVFITKNGSGHLVVMSMDTYEKQLGILDVYRKLGAAEKQLEDGVPLLDGDEVIKRLNEKSSARRIEKYIGESWQSLCSASRKEK